jgi:Heme/copper-type cytochrome/quinol oxidase, subunit 3
MSEHNYTPVGGRVGMWLFIATEVLLFGGMFILYSIYRFKNPAAFHEGSLELSRLFGTINTCILITSSFFVVLGVHSLHVNKRRNTLLFTAATIACAFGFLIVKSFEWMAKFEHGLFPGQPTLLSSPPGEQLYFGLYYIMTGLHAVHVIVGIGVLSAAFLMVKRETVTAQRPLWLENGGLYWHLVDIIWIFLFPLFYLIS